VDLRPHRDDDEPEHPEPNGVAVVARGLSFRYDTPEGELTVLDGLDFDVDAGSTVAITGASGSGKTTLLSVLGGLDRPQAGAVVVGGQDLAQLDRALTARYRREVVGFVFQDFGLLGQLTALENVELALTFERVSRRRRRARARELLAGVGLADRLGHRPRALSGGEKQRVAIARALAGGPSILLADEPTANLDAQVAGQVLTLFRNLAKEQNRALLIVTHDPKVRAIADRVVRIENGLLQSTGGDA
jgi:putative ABC transport system ATP-binding protein